MNPITFPSTVPEHLKSDDVQAWLLRPQNTFRGVKVFIQWIRMRGAPDPQRPSQVFHRVLNAFRTVGWIP